MPDISRRPLTDTLLTVIAAATTRPVGDGEATSACGWQGSANSGPSTFVPYNILVPQTASASSGPFDDPQADWHLPYSIWAFGSKRNQCEAIADLARNSLSDMQGLTLSLGDQKYSVQQVRTESIGAVTRYDQTDPPYWGQQDSITMWLTHERV